MIERNLAERYGDVQAFSTNETVLKRDQWGKPTAAENGIVRAMNSYVNLYGIYTLMLAVDLEGNPIVGAFNGSDFDGSDDNDLIVRVSFQLSF